MEIQKKENDLPYNKILRQKTIKEYSTWRRYSTSPDDKKTATRDTEVPARHV